MRLNKSLEIRERKISELKDNLRQNENELILVFRNSIIKDYNEGCFSCSGMSTTEIKSGIIKNPYLKVNTNSNSLLYSLNLCVEKSFKIYPLRNKEDIVDIIEKNDEIEILSHEFENRTQEKIENLCTPSHFNKELKEFKIIIGNKN